MPYVARGVLLTRDPPLARARIFRNDDQRVLFGRVALYALVLFWVLPLVSGVVAPWWFSLTRHPFDGLPLRLVLLVATGGASLLIVLAPAPLALRRRRRV